MDSKYTCINCAFYASPQTQQGICKFDPRFDTPKAPTDFCGCHSQYAIDYAPVGGGGIGVPTGTPNAVVYYDSTGKTLQSAAPITVGSSGQLILGYITPTVNPSSDGDRWSFFGRRAPGGYSAGLVYTNNRIVYAQNDLTPRTIVNPTTPTSLLTGNAAFPAPGPLTIPLDFWFDGRRLEITAWLNFTLGVAGVVNFGPVFSNLPASLDQYSVGTAGTIQAEVKYTVYNRDISNNVAEIYRVINFAGNVQLLLTTWTMPLLGPVVLDFQSFFTTSDPGNQIILRTIKIEAVN